MPNTAPMPPATTLPILDSALRRLVRLVRLVSFATSGVVRLVVFITTSVFTAADRTEPTCHPSVASSQIHSAHLADLRVPKHT